MTRFNLAIAIVLDVARRLQVAACQRVNRVSIDYSIIDIYKDKILLGTTKKTSPAIILRTRTCTGHVSKHRILLQELPLD